MVTASSARPARRARCSRLPYEGRAARLDRRLAGRRGDDRAATAGLCRVDGGVERRELQAPALRRRRARLHHRVRRAARVDDGDASLGALLDHRAALAGDQGREARRVAEEHHAQARRPLERRAHRHERPDPGRIARRNEQRAHGALSL
ncbi:MAG: hypothetical protein M5U28_38325 [Sandaracinaceae bacterium]|nr:hypothetical protein [Sandaracinaceae bacterium]